MVVNLEPSAWLSSNFLEILFLAQRSLRLWVAHINVRCLTVPSGVRKILVSSQNIFKHWNQIIGTPFKALYPMYPMYLRTTRDCGFWCYQDQIIHFRSRTSFYIRHCTRARHADHWMNIRTGSRRRRGEEEAKRCNVWEKRRWCHVTPPHADDSTLILLCSGLPSLTALPCLLQWSLLSFWEPADYTAAFLLVSKSSNCGISSEIGFHICEGVICLMSMMHEARLSPGYAEGRCSIEV